jgi:DNA-binding CsgD family transcriptional regulator
LTKNIHLNSWYSQLAELAANIGDDSFTKLLAKCCKHVTEYSSILMSAYHRNGKATHLFDDVPASKEKQTLAPYYQGAYLLDPFFTLTKKKAPSGVYKLFDIAPDEFYETEYYKNYYSNIHLTDEFSIVVNVSEELVVVISLGFRCNAQGMEGKAGQLKTVAPLLVELTRKHWLKEEQRRKQSESIKEGSEEIYGQSLENSFIRFGKSHLTEREAQVMRLILQGHSSKAIALILDISPDTVKVHRKRCYFKLQVTSQAELFSLFINALKLAPIKSDEDPLNFYFEEYPLDPNYTTN